MSKSMQGRKLGLKIINTLEAIGKEQGCYKIILDCSKENIRKLIPHFPIWGGQHRQWLIYLCAAFYEKCG